VAFGPRSGARLRLDREQRIGRGGGKRRDPLRRAEQQVRRLQPIAPGERVVVSPVAMVTRRVCVGALGCLNVTKCTPGARGIARAMGVVSTCCPSTEISAQGVASTRTKPGFTEPSGPSATGVICSAA
jgi:hypothetical protein